MTADDGPDRPPQQPQPATPEPSPGRRSFWKGTGGWIVLSLTVGGCLVGLLLAAGFGPSSTRGPNPITASVTGCAATSGALATATINLTVTNHSDQTRDVTIDVEFRDASGDRLDADTAYIRNVAPGDTVRHDESTILDAETTGSLTCAISRVRSY